VEGRGIALISGYVSKMRLRKNRGMSEKPLSEDGQFTGRDCNA